MEKRQEQGDNSDDEFKKKIQRVMKATIGN